MADESTPLLRDSSRNGHLHRGSDLNHAGATQNHDLEQPSELTTSTVTDSKPKVALVPIVIPMAIGIFLAAMEGTIVVSSSATIGSELKQLQNTSWIATGYLLTLTSFQPLYGKLSDIFGRKTCLLFAYSTFALGCLFCGLARNMNELIAARAFAGIGGGGLTTVVSIIMSDIIPLRSRGTWQGMLNIVYATGSATGAPLGGFLADSMGWRWAFLIQVPITLVGIFAVSVAFHLPQTQASNFSTKMKRVDINGVVSLVLTVFFLLLGLDRGGNVAWTDTLTIASLAVSTVMFFTFGVIEMKLASEPFAPKRIIFNRSLIASYFVNFFGLASLLSLLFHFSLYVQAVYHKTASEAGLWLLPNVMGTVLGSLGGGLIMQSTGKYYFLTLGAYVASLFGTTLVVLMTGIMARSFVGMVLGLVVTSVGIGSVVTTSLISLIANAEPHDQAIATAVSYLFRSLGSVIGLSVGSTLVQDVLRSSLRRDLSGQDVETIVRHVRESLTYIDGLDPETRVIVRSSYEQAIRVTLWFSVIMAACGVFSSVFIKEKALAGRS